ncbi:Cytochrome bo(3) ubiquinol oxidase subunit 3 [Roseovarius albus]|uniref:Cytochrome bo(3) ubiquinol oxidase subunit 3 n=1 Tax=Roseovarius albus TaxID=1247867 RepID=A0A1X6ZT14_9RHOB|nr:cytochrome c oxidase subunit 3 [Roseovarius albus]SLN60912.1 Cytochrome bo(3) ubiquinol oxidase subunit 3 [Roseovarius albus]
MIAASDKVEEQIDEETEFGFWLYLMSDAVLFSLLFGTFAVMSSNLAGGPGGSALFDMKNLATQTALLLVSSLTIALAHHAAHTGHLARTLGWLVVTCLLGAGFLGLEIKELSGFVAQDAGPGRSGYLSAFFTLVGTHGLHVTAGLIWAMTLIAQFLIKGIGLRMTSRLYRLTLFWHFLDIVWIGVFSLVYLPEFL